MSLSMENIIKGLKEVTRRIEEGGEVDSNTMGIVEEFLKNFPHPTILARKLSDFPAELLQLIFPYLPLGDLLVCKRWKDVGEGSKLWEDKKLLLQEDMLSPLSCAVEVARRRQIETIQAIGLSSEQVKEVAMEMKSYFGLKELDQGQVDHSPISAVPPQLFRSAFPNLVKINLSNASPTAEQLAFLFSSLSPGGTSIVRVNVKPPSATVVNFCQTLSG